MLAATATARLVGCATVGPNDALVRLEVRPDVVGVHVDIEIFITALEPYGQRTDDAEYARPGHPKSEPNLTAAQRKRALGSAT